MIDIYGCEKEEEVACIGQRAEKKTMKEKKKLETTGVMNVTADVNLKMESIQIKVKQLSTFWA